MYRINWYNECILTDQSCLSLNASTMLKIDMIFHINKCVMKFSVIIAESSSSLRRYFFLEKQSSQTYQIMRIFHVFIHLNLTDLTVSSTCSIVYCFHLIFLSKLTSYWISYRRIMYIFFYKASVLHVCFCS